MRRRKERPHVGFVVYALKKNKRELEEICRELEKLGLRRDVDYQATQPPSVLDQEEVYEMETVPNPKYDPRVAEWRRCPKEIIRRKRKDTADPRYRLEQNIIIRINETDMPIIFALTPTETSGAELTHNNRYEMPYIVIRGRREAIDYLRKNQERIRSNISKSQPTLSI